MTCYPSLAVSHVPTSRAVTTEYQNLGVIDSPKSTLREARQKQEEGGGMILKQVLNSKCWPLT